LNEIFDRFARHHVVIHEFVVAAKRHGLETTKMHYIVGSSTSYLHCHWSLCHHRSQWPAKSFH